MLKTNNLKKRLHSCVLLLTSDCTSAQYIKVQVTTCVFPFQISNAIKKHNQIQNAFTRSFTKHHDIQTYQRNQRRGILLQKEKRAQLVNITQMMCNKQYITCNNL